MRNVLIEALRPVLVAAMAIVMAHCGTGCKDIPSPTESELYTGAQVACATTSSDLVESCKCRKAVDVQFGLCETGSVTGPNCMLECK